VTPVKATAENRHTETEAVILFEDSSNATFICLIEMKTRSIAQNKRIPNVKGTKQLTELQSFP